MLADIGILVCFVLGCAYLSSAAVVVESRINKSADTKEDLKWGKLLTAVRIWSLLIAMLSAVFAAYSLPEDIVALLYGSETLFVEAGIWTASCVVVVLALAYVLIVFGAWLPKVVTLQILSKHRSSKGDVSHGTFHLSVFLLPAHLLFFVLLPFVSISKLLAGVVLKLFSYETVADDGEVTEAEIRMMVDVGEEAGTIDEVEKEMINNVFEFDNKIAGDIATHRKDIAALSINADSGEIIRKSLERYSRIPVYEDNIDNIIGILHTKDLFHAFLSSGANHGFNVDLKSILRKPYFVPFSKKTDELFEDMKKNKVHMAIIIDEYGGTAGLVSMEDLIEEIMGSILDEYDEEEKPEIEQLDSATFVVDGQAPLETVAEFLDTPLPVDDYDTIGGFIIGQIGRIPSKNEKPEIEFGGLIFKVFSIVDNRIDSLIVSKISVGFRE